MVEIVRSRRILRKLYQRSGSKFWYACVRDRRRNRLHHVSTKATREDRARQFINEFIEEKAAAEKQEVLAGSIRFDQAFKEWLSLKNVRPSTMAGYEFAADMYSRVFGHKLVDEISMGDIERFLARLAKAGISRQRRKKDDPPKGLSARTRKQHLSQLKTFFRWCAARRYLSENPTQNIRVERGDVREGVALGYVEASCLLEACKKSEILEMKDWRRDWDQTYQPPAHLYTVMLTSFYTGCAPSSGSACESSTTDSLISAGTRIGKVPQPSWTACASCLPSLRMLGSQGMTTLR